MNYKELTDKLAELDNKISELEVERVQLIRKYNYESKQPKL